MNDTINQVGAAAPADRLREALAGLLAIVDESRGVSGYHLNGAIAEWDEFPEVEAARATLDDLPECGCCGKIGECDADCDARQAILAAAVVQAERVETDDIAAFEAAMPGFHAMLPDPVSSRRAGRRVMKRSNVFKAFLAGRSNPPAQHDAALVEAANAALKAIQDTLEDAYHNAFPECCGQAHLECCGSPIQAWDERDKKIMDRLGPHEKALRAALAGKGGAQ